MPRAGLSTEAVVAAAAELADAEGLRALTLAALAAQLGVRTPSLYAHVDGLEDLRERLATRGAVELADALTAATAGRSGGEALSELAHAYRAYAHEHPGAYEALQRAPLTRGAQASAAAQRIVALLERILAGYGLQGEQALHSVRAIRAAMHGFVSLEAQEGFGLGLSLDDSFERLVAMIEQALAAQGR